MTTDSKALSAVEIAGKLSKTLEGWMHNPDDCNRSAHQDCGVCRDGTYRCDEAFSREMCEEVICDCGLSDVQEMATLLAGMLAGAQPSAVQPDA